MRNVSFKVAKYLKDIGYPQELYYGVWYFADENSVNAIPFCGVPLRKVYWIDPTYIEVWLWLWQEKGIYIQVERNHCILSFSWGDSCTFKINSNPEEAINATIEYLVDNDLIK